MENSNDKNLAKRILEIIYQFTIGIIIFEVFVVKIDYSVLKKDSLILKILYSIYFYSIGFIVRFGMKYLYRLLMVLLNLVSVILHKFITFYFSKFIYKISKSLILWPNQDIPKVLFEEETEKVEGFKKVTSFFTNIYPNFLKPALRTLKIKIMQRQRRKLSKYEHWIDKDTSQFLVNNAIYLVIFAMIITIIAIKPNFLSWDVFKNILTQSSVRMILAFGVGGIIILQGTDLSLGRSVGFAAMISASLLQSATYPARFYENLGPLPLIIPLVLAMIVSGFFSSINGFVVAKFKIHPFLATLGASVALYGLLSMYFSSGDAGAQPIGGLDPRYTEFVIGDFNLFGLEIKKLIVYALLIALVVWVIWNKTSFGKNMYAVGGNPEAANISGVSVLKTTIMVYILAGLLYGIGGFLEAARIGSVSNSTGINYELDAIAACVVGGISFSGGIGKVKGAITGVLMFTIITYGMNFLGLDVFYQYIVKGVIIVLAVALDTRKYILKT
jgi:methyl-galactoside transport system permease protein